MFTPKNRICPRKSVPVKLKLPKNMPKSVGYVEKPIHIPDSQFGISYDPEELIMKIKLGEPNDPDEVELPHGYIRPWKDPEHNDAGSTVAMDEEKFEAILDVKQFSPEELTVTIDGVNVVAVEGKQESKEEHGGFVDRYFKRKYYVPPAFDCEKIECKLSKDRIIMISIPRLNPQENEEKIVIPIVQTETNMRDEIKKRLETLKKNNY